MNDLNELERRILKLERDLHLTKKANHALSEMYDRESEANVALKRKVDDLERRLLEYETTRPHDGRDV